MNSWDATAPFPLSRRDMLKTRSWRHGTLTKVILLSTFIFNLLTFRNLSQRLKVKNGDFKHFTCISAWEIRAWHVPSHPGWVGPPKFFWGFFSHGIYVWAYTGQNLRNFGFLNHPIEQLSSIYPQNLNKSLHNYFLFLLSLALILDLEKVPLTLGLPLSFST